LSMFIQSSCEKLDQSTPMVFTHRDFHSKNIFRGGHIWNIIDFQDARLGLPWYDLVSLVYDPYVSIPRDLREKVVAEYVQASKQPFVENLYYLQAFQRTVKAMGTYLTVISDRQLPEYLDALKQALGYLEEIVQLGGFPDHTFLFFNRLNKAICGISLR